MNRIIRLKNLNNAHFSMFNHRNYDIGFSLFIDEEDSQSPEYFMQSEYINNQDSNEKAWLMGKYFIRVFNGILNIVNPLNDDEFESTADLETMFEFINNLNTPNITPRNINKRDPIINPIETNLPIDKKILDGLTNSAREQLLYLAVRRDDFRNLFLISAGELNWITLYQMLDTVLNYTNKNFLKLLTEHGIFKKQISLFKRTANSFGILSYHSRHGVTKVDPNFEPMKYFEAKEMIRRICLIYLNEQVNNIK